jgi:hypothetical protein
MTSHEEILVEVHDFFKSPKMDLYFWMLATQTAFINDDKAKIILSQGAMTIEAVRNLERLIPKEEYRGKAIYSEPVTISAQLLGLPQLGQLIVTNEIPNGMYFKGIMGYLYKRDGNEIVGVGKS